MKLIRYGNKGFEKPGIIDENGDVRDLSDFIADIDGSTITADTLDRIRALDPQSLPKIEGSFRVGPCVGQVGKFVCVGLNYADHAAESNLPIPVEPIVFQKATSSICGPNDDVTIPPGSEKTDWEVELGIVIGKSGSHIKEADAFDHIAGYCVVHDVSERSYQNERGGQWTKGKSYDTFGPIGPWLVTADEVPDVHNLRLWLTVDGAERQAGSTETMIFSVPFLVDYISQFMSLQPGDIISTGTPPGVGMGMKPPTFLRAGQTVRLGIQGLGEQEQRTVMAG
ncbi:fumarylacetoacetate hydrolase family protein [Rhizobium sp. BK060]|uniref:fumarylacetoacetate hydrolase family protein n=1 Tax=Rhizobium sp. BK060 TaxID=2587096 RepID=UPI001616A5AD|nr:fumarylacetoacetate hydrolase family protein [Rhizobium sp. BK060]MBB3394252.1 2-keto-4-pentenoate hydratase/2-oxohepta-3-ene-1,7-dioic acid hydratase in catechol pathway [Rhizobium sp. BK060]